MIYSLRLLGAGQDVFIAFLCFDFLEIFSCVIPFHEIKLYGTWSSRLIAIFSQHIEEIRTMCFLPDLFLQSEL